MEDLDHNKVLEQAPTIDEIRQAEAKMDSSPFLIDTFINNIYPVHALFDTGCLPFAAFSEDLVRAKNLPRIPIPARDLKLAKNDPHTYKIKDITYCTLDINGRRERIWGYIIRHLHYELILGKAWAEDNDVVYKARKRLLRIGNGSQRINIREHGWMENPHVRARTAHIQAATMVGASIFKAIVRRAEHRKEPITVASVTLADVNKALKKFS